MSYTPVPTGTDIQVNTTTSGSQQWSAIAALDDGGFVVTWSSATQDLSGWGVYAQRYDADGVAVGGEVRVNTVTSGDQIWSSVTGLANGGFVIAWASVQDGSGHGVYGQRYDASGSAVGGEFRINSTVAGGQVYTSLSALSDGGFVAVWASDAQDGDSWGIVGQRYSANGTAVGGEFEINTFTTGDQNYPSVIALADGDILVTWSSYAQDGTGDWGVYGQRYDAAGTPVGGEFRISPLTGSGLHPSTAALSDGGFVVAWSDYDSSGRGIYGQRYDESGSAVGGRFQISTYTSADQVYASVTALSDGGFVVAWSSDGQDGSGYGIYGQRFDASGAAIGTEFRINSITGGQQYNASDYGSEYITLLDDGRLAVTWTGTGSAEVFFRLIDVPTIEQAFTGARADYTVISYNSSASRLIVWSEAEGRQTIYSAGSFDFSDGTYTLEQLLASAADTRTTLIGLAGSPITGSGTDGMVFDATDNFASVANGASVAVASSLLGPSYPQHEISDLNDGEYGNDSSWIPAAGQTESWIKIDLGQLRHISTVTFGRDRASGLNDRDVYGNIVISVAVSDNVYADGDYTNDDQEYVVVWSASNVSLGALETFLATFSPAYVRYVKIEFTHSSSFGDLPAIDEVEVYGIGDINVAPSGTDGTLQVSEDTPYQLTVGDFGFGEWNVTDEFVSVRIDTLPTAGQLQLDGQAVRAGDVIAVADIANLRYVPPANASGAGLASFTFSVFDGEDFDPTPNTLTLDVTAVNDAPTFAVGDGIVTTAVGSSADIGFSVALQADGGIVVAGISISGSSYDFALVRYTSAGALDSTFGGGDGAVTTPIGSSHDYGRSVTVQPDGGILVAGYFYNSSGIDFALVRYTSAGALDTTFGGGDGIVTTLVGSSNDAGYSVTVQPDGGILVAGYTSNGSNDDIALVRYTSAGVLDTTFGGGDGIVTTPIGSSNDIGYSVAVQPDGGILVAGHSFNGSDWDFALVRYTSAGVLDATFGGGDGIVTTPIGSSNDYGYSVTVQPDGGILVAGYSGNGSNADFALVRYTSAGVLDTTFGGGDGIVTTPVGLSTDWGYSVTAQSDGGILVAGYSSNGSNNDFALVRYTSAGVLDTTFGGGDGIVTTPIGSSDDQGFSVTVQPDGGILVVGQSHSGSSYDFAIVRYNADGTLDTTFDPVNTLGGTVSFTEGGSAVVLDSAVQIQDVELDALNGGAGDYAGASLTIARNSGASAQDAYSFDTSGAPFTVSGANLQSGGQTFATFTTTGGTLTVTFTSSGTAATSALVDAVLSRIAYTNISNSPPSSVTLDWAFSDGNNSGTQGTGGVGHIGGSTTVNITAVNDAPTASGSQTVTQIAETDQTTAIVVATGTMTDDTAGSNVASFTGPDADMFSVQFGSWSSVGANGLRTRTFTITLDANQEIDFETQQQIEANFVIDDATVGSSPDFSLPLSLTVLNVNDAPVFSELGGTVSFTEGGSAVVLDADVSIVDAELAALNGGAGNYAGASLTIARNGGADAEDGFGFDTSGASFTVSGGNLQSGGQTFATFTVVEGLLTITFTSSATAATSALVEDVLRHVVYTNASDATPPSSVTLDWSFSDGNSGAQGSGGPLTATGSTTVNITAVNDAPVAVIGPASFVATEQTALDLKGVMTAYDVDDGGGTITVTLSVGEGRLIVQPGTSGALVLGSGTFNVTITGTVAQVYALLNTDNTSVVSYTNTSDTPSASTTLTLTVNDNGHGGTGGPLTATDTATITIAPVNDAPTFNFGDGVVETDFGGYYEGAYSIALQADGRMVVAGYTYSGGYVDFAIARYNSDGSLDATFGTGGLVRTDFSFDFDGARSVKIQPDGKIVVVGDTVTNGSVAVAVARYNSDGSLDTSFNGDGTLILGIGVFASASDVAVLPDGKLLISGNSDGGGGSDCLLVRLNVDGSFDTTFGAGGVVLTDFGSASDVSQSLVLQADGKIVVAGNTDTGSTAALAIARYNSDGLLDTSFDADGVVTVAFGSAGGSISALATQPDGKIVVTGRENRSGWGSDLVVFKFNSDGSPDTSFSDDGKVTLSLTDGFDNGYDIAVQSDGKIVVSGRSGGGSSEIVVARFNMDGTLDTSFGQNGVASTNRPTQNDSGYGLIIQPDGMIVVVGSTNPHSRVTGDEFIVVRFTADGTLDGSFDTPVTTGFTENGAPVVLNANATVFDAELAALNGGAGDYAGASLTIARNGGADGDDGFGFDTAGASFTISGGNLQSGGQTFATVSNTGGELTIIFTSSSTVATSALVEDVLQRILYANSSDTPPSSVVLDWTFSDGNSGPQGSGGPLTATGSTTVNITASNDDPTDIALSNAAVNEITANGTVIGTLSATDPDSSAFTYALTDSHGGRFVIVGNELRVANGLLLDHEQAGTHTIEVEVSDGSGGTRTETFVITIGNVDPETVVGTGASETFVGGGLNDTLDGGGGTDTLVGRLGDDTYYVDDLTDVVTEAAGEGNDRVFARASYVLATGQSIELLATSLLAGTVAINLTGNELGQTIYGNAGINTLSGGGGLDRIYGFGGNDTIDGGTGNDILDGGEGNDTVTGGSGTDTMSGGLGDDTFYVDNAGDVVTEAAGEGSDRVYASVAYTLGAGQAIELLATTQLAGTAAINLTGNDLGQTIHGNAGINTLSGNGGLDKIYGFGGNDTLDGGSGNDILVGGEGNDTLIGGLGTDTMIGELGDDTFYVDAAGDIVTEAAGGGSDRVLATVSYTLGAGQAIELLATTLVAGTGAINLTGNDLGQIIYGNNGVNTLFGGGGADRLYGYLGADTLDGGTGNDIVDGGEGGDTLNGGLGTDTLTGGLGADVFVFNTALSSIDTITDFNIADDTIHLDNAIFTGLIDGALPASWFVIGASAQDSSDRIIYNSGTGALFYDADGLGGAAQVQFATIGTGLAGLSANDFVVV